MTTDKKFKGLVVFWVNLHPDMGQDTRETLELVKEMNKPLLDHMTTEDGRYRFLFIPTFKESTRIEKIDFDEPFPRYISRGIDVYKHGIQTSVVVEEKKKKQTTLLHKRNSSFREIQEGKPEEEDHGLKGIITFFINFHPDTDVDIADTLSLIKEFNQDAIRDIDEDGRFKIILIPTTKEGSRAEKVDWDMPFPRLMQDASLLVQDEEEPEDDDDDEEPEDGDE